MTIDYHCYLTLYLESLRIICYLLKVVAIPEVQKHTRMPQNTDTHVNKICTSIKDWLWLFPTGIATVIILAVWWCFVTAGYGFLLCKFEFKSIGFNFFIPY